MTRAFIQRTKILGVAITAGLLLAGNSDTAYGAPPASKSGASKSVTGKQADKGKTSANIGDSAKAIAKAIDSAGIFPPNHHVVVQVEKNTATVLAHRPLRVKANVRKGEEELAARKALEDDLKIDAVLTTRKIRQVNGTISNVHVKFFGSPTESSFFEVHVNDVDIIAFEKGVVNERELLSGLKVTTGSTAEEQAMSITAMDDGADDEQMAKHRLGIAALLPTPSGMRHPRNPETVDWLHAEDISPGPLRADRLSLLGRIQDLGARYDVSLLLKAFVDIEQHAVKEDRPGTKARVENLRATVTSWEQRLESPRGQASLGGKRTDDAAHIYETMQRALLNDQDIQSAFLKTAGKFMGDNAPRSGPFIHRRYQIAGKIEFLKSKGIDTRKYVEYYQAIERMMPDVDKNVVRPYIENLETALGLPHAEVIPTK